MTIHYSAARRGFFDTDLHAELPEDAVYIRPSRYAELMEQQAAGARIESNSQSGRPVGVWPSADERRAALHMAIKSEASRRILSISPLWRQFNDLREPTPAAAGRFAEIDTVRAASAALEHLVAGLPAAELEGFDPQADKHWTETD